MDSRKIYLRSPALADASRRAILASYVPQWILDRYDIEVVEDEVILTPKGEDLRNVGGDGI